MYADVKGAFNAADHRIMFKHMRQLGMPPTFVDTCEQLYGVSTTAYITPYGPTPSININRGTLQGGTLSPFLFTLSLEPFLRWLTVGSRTSSLFVIRGERLRRLAEGRSRRSDTVWQRRSTGSSATGKTMYGGIFE
jgi:hypothetical protein